MRKRDWTEDCPGCPPAYNTIESSQIVMKRCEKSFFPAAVEIVLKARWTAVVMGENCFPFGYVVPVV